MFRRTRWDVQGNKNLTFVTSSGHHAWSSSNALRCKIIDRAHSPCNMVKFFWAMMNVSYWSECSRCIGHIATPLNMCIPCCPVIANVFWTAFHILVKNESIPVGPLNRNARQLVHDASWIMESMFSSRWNVSYRWHGTVLWSYGLSHVYCTVFPDAQKRWSLGMVTLIASQLWSVMDTWHHIE